MWFATPSGHTQNKGQRVWPNVCDQGLDGCGQAKKGFNWVWLEFLMGVVRLKKVSTGCGWYF